jgi:hypothetical protein
VKLMKQERSRRNLLSVHSSSATQRFRTHGVIANLLDVKGKRQNYRIGLAPMHSGASMGERSALERERSSPSIIHVNFSLSSCSSSESQLHPSFFAPSASAHSKISWTKISIHIVLHHVRRPEIQIRSRVVQKLHNTSTVSKIHRLRHKFVILMSHVATEDLHCIRTPCVV